ncbi:MAG: hypothetical protein IT530_16105 [Burkholderiales bacterium]|nr:hypothetical protein [Burkholderiales bacterium]
MATMQDVERLVEKYSARSDALAGTVSAFREELGTLEKKYFGRLRKLAVARQEAQDAVTAAIAESPELFAKPRSVTMHGTKVGLRKGSGKMTIEDEELVVKLIHRHFPEQAEILIQTIEKPVRAALTQLSVAELKRVAVTVEDTGDVPFVKSVDTEIEKAIKALVKRLPDAVGEQADA